MKKKFLFCFALVLAVIISLVPAAGCNLVTDVSSAPVENPPVSANATPIDSGYTVPVTEGQSPILPSIADVVALVKPSVVAITTEVVSFDFFNRQFTQEGAGSGWIISEDGVIVTNNHVVEGASSITVTLDDGRTFAVDLATVATDGLADLAVLKIDAAGLPAATVGDSSRLRIGDWVVAIGNSLGQGIRATQGIVSRSNVSLEIAAGQQLYGLIETDAAINPGNSGGPLVNMAGEVVGLTSVKIAEVGVEGVGYAISTQEASPIIEQLINMGYVIRPWLGVGLYTVDQLAIMQYGLQVDSGVLLVTIAAGSPADNAGLEAGDVIVAINGSEIADVEQFTRALHSSQIGETIEITYWRGSVSGTTLATLIERPQ